MGRDESTVEDVRTKCEHCGRRTYHFISSSFNYDEICSPCWYQEDKWIKDRTAEIVNLLAAVKRSGHDVLTALTSLAQEEAVSRGFSDVTLAYAHLSLFSGDPRHLRPAIKLAVKLNRHALLARLDGVIKGFRLDLDGSVPPMERPLGRQERVDERFLAHCRKNKITVLRQLQVGLEGREACRSVFLALDADGLVKVFKELRPSESSRLGLVASEQEIYERLGAVPGLPRYYGTTEIDEDLRFLRLGVCYGRSLDDLIVRHGLRPGAQYIVGRLADTLARLHSAKIVYNDLRPSNVKIDGDQVHLLDVGDAQFLPDGSNEVTTYVHGSQYVAPEVILRHKAQPASDVFQLGIVYYQLMTGRHPFNHDLPSETDHELLRLRDCLANLTLAPEFHGNDLFARMLSFDPDRRPTAAEVAEALKGDEPPQGHGRRRSIPETNGTVLFPSRIGIPHRGHIDFIARLLELGYEVLVSLNAAYVLTSMDPLPKWLVMKMVGRSLAMRGFDTSRVRFLCTPLLTDADQIGPHYALMPGIEEVVAVASGNSEVHRLFQDRWPIIDQAAVFGSEGEDYETRSWGHRLREAVRNNDRAVFDELIAPGAEEILSFEEMRAYCSRPPMDFAWGRERGRVSVVLRDAADKELVRERVSTYSTPEDTLVRAIDAVFVDRLSRDSIVKIGAEDATLVFEDAALEGQNLSIFYRLHDERRKLDDRERVVETLA